ncbi:hypothetical protein [Jidongwangia harbinensis]|uniref:hypothetical protein n=1 Tax=Jidongwangia harbinensis TaxID=2878561 RepID=UPI001CD99E95|nr:hypothetical protein [Jidongwangia harbinensis]MCA2211622.1 hypothetical protein [Jidongwangia harbinensis]
MTPDRHDPSAGSHGTAAESHGTAAESHGTAAESHGTAAESQGTAAGSHGAAAGRSGAPSEQVRRRTVPTELAALATGVSPDTVRQWARRGKLTRHGTPGRAEYDLEELAGLMDRRTRGGRRDASAAC